jgi:hypothetical protein
MTSDPLTGQNWPAVRFTPLARLRFVAWEEGEALLQRWGFHCLGPDDWPRPSTYWRPGVTRYYAIDPAPDRSDAWQGYVEWHEAWNADGACARGDDMISLAARLAGTSYRQAAARLARLLALEAVA